MVRDLYIDIETFSSVDIQSCGAYKYIESPDFEIVLLSYAFDNESVKTVDLLSGEDYPDEFLEAMEDPEVIKHAHNAVFERRAFMKEGIEVPIEQWRCTAVKAAYCGLPLGLEAISKILDLKEKKLDTGKALIKYFSCPCKPTKVNGGRTRNYPHHAPEKWAQYKEYNDFDVRSEREIDQRLKKFVIPESELALYALDQQINDNGILIDLKMAENAINIDAWYSEELKTKVKEITGLDNPNSAAQLKAYLTKRMGRQITSLLKADVPGLIAECKDEDAKFVLQARQRLAKSSVKKYTAMLNCAGEDSRARGLFQFYGANRTGRWAGRLIQLQNLPQNHLPQKPVDELTMCRDLVATGQGETIEMLYDDVPNILSQLIRTAFIAPEGKIFAVADFSAIEARVLSWYADEDWRLEVFRTHGKIYEATASRMFGVPIEMVTKGSDLRQKGKIAELALGYGGSLGAMKRMGGDKMGLSDPEMMSSVRKWRKANEGICDFWAEVEACALKAVRYQTRVESIHDLVFEYEDDNLTVKLPSGRKLFYVEPRIRASAKGPILHYKGIIQETKQWGELDTYGGKLTENIVQATARDLLANVMLRLSKEGYKIVMHVHDEMIAEVPEAEGKAYLNKMCDAMAQEVPWAKGLPLRGDGYITKYYKKD